MTPYLQKRHAIANEPDTTLRRLGLHAEGVRKALGTRERKSIAERVENIKLGWLVGSLPTYEIILRRIEQGETMGPALIARIVKSVGLGAKDVTTSMYHFFGSCNPKAEDLREFVAAAKRRVRG